MHILIAPDKFKDALTAMEAARALEAGILQALPQASCTLLPLADGGEGTAALLTHYAKGKMLSARVHDPLLRPVDAAWGYAPKSQQAFIELAAASGLRLLSTMERNPLHTSSFGTGELIAGALAAGATTLTIGLGGSATNDGGTGMAAALGYRFYKASGKMISHPCGQDLAHIRHIDASAINPRLASRKIIAACDVKSPLTGPQGAAYTFARQKGASEDDIKILEEGLSHLAALIKNELGIDTLHQPCAGAAGGAGAGVLAFLGGSLQNGAEMILAQSEFSRHLSKADYLLTGEGKVDTSSLEGKLLNSLCQQAAKQAKKVIVFCGSSSLTAAQAEKRGLHALIPVSPAEQELQEALKNTSGNLEHAARHYFSQL